MTTARLPITDDRDSRFQFGENWQRFLSVLTDERIAIAQEALRTMLGVEDLAGRTFVDVGSGSGLSSLAAMRLGAARVHSFDFDRRSVACTAELKRRYYPGDPRWTVEEGSALDGGYLGRLGQFDVVYSWGVLHHTGAMWDGLANAAALVAPSGRLFVAIYNDQGVRSRLWTGVKRFYNVNAVTRGAVIAAFVPVYVAGGLALDLARLRDPRLRYRAHTRGMSYFYDLFDWLGGYPFEVASRDAIVDFYRGRRFALLRLNGCGSRSGCNEFVFHECSASPS